MNIENTRNELAEKVEQVLTENPKIEHAEIRELTFIIGMPRTGTTILNALLHEDPAHRSPPAWECLIPRILKNHY